MAIARPILFQPPFSVCIIGQSGLLVEQANLATTDIMRPIPHAMIRVSRRGVLPRSAKNVAVHAAHVVARANAVTKRRLAGSWNLYASRETSESRWSPRRFLIAAYRRDGMARNTGEITAAIATSYPEMPMCHRGKYHTRTGNPVTMVQKTNYGQKLATRQLIVSKIECPYPVVNIASSVKDLGPEEAFAEGIADGLAFPKLRCQFPYWAETDYGCTHSFSRTESAVVFNCLEGKNFRHKLFSS
jgi:hypothetical protein